MDMSEWEGRKRNKAYETSKKPEHHTHRPEILALSMQKSSNWQNYFLHYTDCSWKWCWLWCCWRDNLWERFSNLLQKCIEQHLWREGFPVYKPAIPQLVDQGGLKKCPWMDTGFYSHEYKAHNIGIFRPVEYMPCHRQLYNDNAQFKKAKM